MKTPRADRFPELGVGESSRAFTKDNSLSDPFKKDIISKGTKNVRIVLLKGGRHAVVLGKSWLPCKSHSICARTCTAALDYIGLLNGLSSQGTCKQSQVLYAPN